MAFRCSKSVVLRRVINAAFPDRVGRGTARMGRSLQLPRPAAAGVQASPLAAATTHVERTIDRVRSHLLT
jgi:hypothetical protein